MRVSVEGAPEELAAKAGQLLKALAKDLADASPEARSVLDALEHEHHRFAERPMATPLEALRKECLSIAAEELRKLADELDGPRDKVCVLIQVPPALAVRWPADGRVGEDSSPPHFTMLYLGKVRPGRHQEVTEVVRRVAATLTPFELHLAPGVRWFTGHSGKEIAYKGVSPDGEARLRRLHDDLRQALEAAGFEPEHKEFIAHSTLAYRPAGAREYPWDVPDGSFLVDHLVVSTWSDSSRWAVPVDFSDISKALSEPQRLRMRDLMRRTWLRTIARSFGPAALTQAEQQEVSETHSLDALLSAYQEGQRAVGVKDSRPGADQETRLRTQAAAQGGSLLEDLTDRSIDRLEEVMAIQIETPAAVEHHDHLKELAAALRTASGECVRDWDRVAVTELQAAANTGRAAGIQTLNGGDPEVYKMPAPDACQWCRDLHLGPDGHPRIFPLSALTANGDNRGRSKAAWRAVVGPTHPNCLCPLGHVPSGWGFDDDGDLVPGGEGGARYRSAAELRKALHQERAARSEAWLEKSDAEARRHVAAAREDRGWAMNHNPRLHAADEPSPHAQRPGVTAAQIVYQEQARAERAKRRIIPIVPVTGPREGADYHPDRDLSAGDVATIINPIEPRDLEETERLRAETAANNAAALERRIKAKRHKARPDPAVARVSSDLPSQQPDLSTG